MADSNNDKPVENILKLTDEIVHQLNKTKKIVIWIIISSILVVLGTHVITFALLGQTILEDGPQDGPPSFSPVLRIVQPIVIGTILVLTGIGIRQGFVLSKWTKKYKQYKEFQKKLDEELDEDNNEKQLQRVSLKSSQLKVPPNLKNHSRGLGTSS